MGNGVNNEIVQEVIVNDKLFDIIDPYISKVSKSILK